MTGFTYRPDVDGLRALAVTLVLLFHGGLGIPGGFVGVDVFFVISGYLITGLILAQQHAGTFRLSAFYARRIRRIIPACAAMVAFCLVTGGILLFPEDYVELARSAVSQQALASNVFFWKTLDYFGTSAEFKPLLHTWSLSVEEQFYLFYPLLLTMLAMIPRRMAVAILGAILLGSLALSEWGVRNYRDAAFFLLPTRAWELLLGGMLWYAPVRFLATGRTADVIGVAGLAMILVSAFRLDSQSRFPGVAALPPCVGTAMLIAANTHHPTFIGRCLAMKPVVRLGLISYSLYLWHWPLLALSRHWNYGVFSTRSAILALAASLPLAWLSWRYLETPLRRSDAWARPRLALIGIMATAPLLLVCSYVVIRSQGFPGRCPPKAMECLLVQNERVGRYRQEMSADDIRTGNVPRFGAVDDRVACLVWGDSHAMALLPGLDAACVATGVVGHQATHSATPPLLDFVFSDVYGLRDRSPAFSSAVVEYAIANRIRVVFLAAYWNLYASQKTFEHCLRATVDALHEAGIVAVVVLDVPNQRVDVPRALARSIWTGRSPAGVGLPRDRWHAQLDTISIRLRRLVGDKAVIFDPAPAFVTESEFWPAVLDDRALYFDHHHLSRDGSLKLELMFATLLANLSREADHD